MVEEMEVREQGFGEVVRTDLQQKEERDGTPKWEF